MAGVTPKGAFAATWRNEQGEVVGTTYGGTMCRWPTMPWRIRFHRDGFEGVIPCGECPGCLEFYRRRLAARFQSRYAALGTAKPAELATASPTKSAGIATQRDQLRDKRDVTHPRSGLVVRNRLPQLFAVRIYAPAELHAQYSRRFHRRPRLELEPGFVRCGSRSFFLLVRAPENLARVLGAIGLRFRIHPVRLSRGARAWRALTAGLIVAREIYGEQRNRWYARGLPQVDRQKWEVRKVGKYQSYDRSSSPRAWSSRGLVLVPPEVWKLSRTDRRSLRGKLLRASDPEGVRRVMGLVAQALGSAAPPPGGADLGTRIGGVMHTLASDSGRSSGVDRIRDKVSTGSSNSRLPIPDTAKAEGRSGRRHSAASYQKIAERSLGTTAPPAASGSIPPFSEMGGYVSSEHSQGELLPKQLADADRKEWRKGRAARILAESLAIIERMRKKTIGEE